MAKPKIPNQKQKYQELNKRLMKYVTLVEQIYDTLNLEAAKVAARTSYDNDNENPFRFSDYPQTKDSIAKLQAQFVSDISAIIYTGTSEEWKESNLVQDLVADKVLKAYGAQVNGKKYEVFYQTNSDALKAFQQRKDKGLNISDKLWDQSRVYKDELEAAISCAIEKGTSAVTLSKQISKYLLDFPSLQKDYKQKYGKAANIYDCEYRSIRLARSEINMAYRTAEQTRWQQFDFVVGYEIKLSNNHNCKGIPAGQFYDICDELAGKYPKTFKWSSWHPNCRCYEIPILKTEEEFWAWDEEKGNDTGSVNEVKDVPENFKQWVDKNTDRIETAKKRGTLPYFIKDNKERVDGIIDQQASLIDMGKIRERRKEIRTLVKSLTGQNFTNEDFGKPIKISNRGVKEWLNQPHKNIAKKNEALLNIRNILNNANYLGYTKDAKNRIGVVWNHVFEIQVGGEKSWVLVHEMEWGEYLIHSISDSPNVTIGVKK